MSQRENETHMKISEGNWMRLVSYPVSRSYWDLCFLPLLILVPTKDGDDLDEAKQDLWPSEKWCCMTVCSASLLSRVTMVIKVQYAAWVSLWVLLHFFSSLNELARYMMQITSGLSKPRFNDLTGIISKLTWNAGIIKVKCRNLCRLIK